LVVEFQVVVAAHDVTSGLSDNEAGNFFDGGVNVSVVVVVVRAGAQFRTRCRVAGLVLRLEAAQRVGPVVDEDGRGGGRRFRQPDTVLKLAKECTLFRNLQSILRIHISTKKVFVVTQK
jgi:hypothetical protein